MICLVGLVISPLRPPSSQPLGGLARRAGYFASGSGTSAEFIALEGGDLCGRRPTGGMLEFQVALSALEFMGYAAVGLGERDLALGADFLELDDGNRSGYVVAQRDVNVGVNELTRLDFLPVGVSGDNFLGNCHTAFKVLLLFNGQSGFIGIMEKESDYRHGLTGLFKMKLPNYLMLRFGLLKINITGKMIKREK